MSRSLQGNIYEGTSWEWAEKGEFSRVSDSYWTTFKIRDQRISKQTVKIILTENYLVTILVKKNLESSIPMTKAN